MLAPVESWSSTEMTARAPRRAWSQGPEKPEEPERSFCCGASHLAKLASTENASGSWLSPTSFLSCRVRGLGQESALSDRSESVSSTRAPSGLFLLVASALRASLFLGRRSVASLPPWLPLSLFLQHPAGRTAERTQVEDRAASVHRVVPAL